MDWAQNETDTILKSTVSSALTGDSDIEVFNDQLYAALAALLDGEALDILMNTTEGNGLEAWRKIAKRFDLKTKGRIRGNLMQLLAPQQWSINELSSRIEQWEESVRRHKGKARKPVDEDIRVASLTSMCPKIFQNLSLIHI